MQVGRLRDLTTQNPRLTEPYSQPVDEELWALNVSIYDADNAERYRVVYAIYDLYCVVLHSYPLVGAAADPEHAIARSRWRSSCVASTEMGFHRSAARFHEVPSNDRPAMLADLLRWSAPDRYWMRSHGNST